MQDSRDTWVRTATGWLTPANVKDPLEGPHGPHAQRFVCTSRMVELLGVPAVFACGLFFYGAQAITSGEAAQDPTALLGVVIAFLGGVALMAWALHTAYHTRGAIVIDPVAGYIDLPSRLLTKSHRAAPSVASPAPGRARIAFADLTRVERRELTTRRHYMVSLYIADRHGDVELYIEEPQIDTARALIVGETGWLSRG